MSAMIKKKPSHKMSARSSRLPVRSRFSRKRNDSLFSISEIIGAFNKETQAESDIQAKAPAPLKIVHQTDAPKPFMVRRINRAEALVPIIEQLRALHEELMSELFFHKCSFVSDGIFLPPAADQPPRLSERLESFMFGDTILNSIRDDDNHNTTYYNQVTNERILSIIHVLASVKDMPVVTSFSY